RAGGSVGRDPDPERRRRVLLPSAPAEPRREVLCRGPLVLSIGRRGVALRLPIARGARVRLASHRVVRASPPRRPGRRLDTPGRRRQLPAPGLSAPPGCPGPRAAGRGPGSTAGGQQAALRRWLDVSRREERGRLEGGASAPAAPPSGGQLVTRTLNLFYEEPNPDRWMPLDRYPRQLARRLIRGRPPIGGVERLFVNLRAGLELLGPPVRINDYRYAARHPDDLVGIVGKPHVLDQRRWENPVLFGPGVYSHPSDDPDLSKRLPVGRGLVGCVWMRQMFEPYYDRQGAIWGAGSTPPPGRPAPAGRTPSTSPPT